jgi:hypothetical protein
LVSGKEATMSIETVTVRAEWDPEASVWYTAESSLFGLNAEGETVEALAEKLPGMIQDLLEVNGLWQSGTDNAPVALELTTRTTTLVHSNAA